MFDGDKVPTLFHRAELFEGAGVQVVAVGMSAAAAWHVMPYAYQCAFRLTTNTQYRATPPL